MVDVFAVQDEIATRVATALRASLAEEKKSHAVSTQNIEAYQEYLRGRQLWSRGSDESLQQALLHFQKAVEIDPRYALAYVGIADAKFSQSYRANVDTKTMMYQASTAIQKALALDPDLGEAYASLGTLRWTNGDALGADEAFRKAITLSPGDALIYSRYGRFLFDDESSFEEAKRMLDRALLLDPAVAKIQATRGLLEGLFGHSREALRFAYRGIEIDPQDPTSYFIAAYLLRGLGRLDESTRYYKRALALDQDPAQFMMMGRNYLALGEESLAEETFNAAYRAKVDDSAANFGLADLAFYRGKYRQAADYAARAWDMTVDKHSPRLVAIPLLMRIDLAAGQPEAALARAHLAHPDLAEAPPKVTLDIIGMTPWYAQALIATGKRSEAQHVLALAERYLNSNPRLPVYYGITVLMPRILVLQGRKVEALTALRTAVDAGDGYDLWLWRDDPIFAPIAQTPEFLQCVELVRARNEQQRRSLREQPDLPSSATVKQAPGVSAAPIARRED
jgi:Tfp pilus assembly protein PilF